MIHRHRYTVDDYYRMAESGILSPDARVELIEGEIIDMPPIGAPHASAVNRLHQQLLDAVHGQVIVRGQSPVRLDSRNEPEPDIALVRNRSGHYRDRHPSPTDVLLLVEVADSSLRYDRDVKMALYARFGIPETWLINLADATLTAFRAPGAEGYAMAELLATDRPIPLPGLEGLSVDLAGLF
nr:Uma2 family endonuclease [Thiocystis violacea]